MTSHRAITVGLLWHSVNSDNLGIGALTISQIEIVEKVASNIGVDVDFLVICWKDPRPPYLAKPNLEVVSLRTRQLLLPESNLCHIAKRCDIILDITAGDGFTDIYGLRRFILTCIAKYEVILSGTRYILSPQTIGPFDHRWVRPLVRALLRRIPAVVTRDNATTQFLEELGVVDNVAESTDVAFRLPYQQPLGNANGRLRVGFNISGLLFNGGYTGSNMFGLMADYRAVVIELLNYFTSLAECELHLISHVISQANVIEDDFRVSRELSQKFPNVTLAPPFPDPSAAKSYIAGMDFFFGSRMHACIAAFSAGVPIVPIAYSRKFFGVFGSLGYDVLADCRKHTAEEITKIVIDAFKRKNELKSMVRIALRKADTKLKSYESILSDNFLLSLK